VNYRRGFFRLWVIASVVWAAATGVIGYTRLRTAYDLTLARGSYEFTDASGRKIEVSSPSREYAEAYIKSLLAPGARLSVTCRDGRTQCEPADRALGEGLKLLSGGSISSDGIIEGPFWIEDGLGFDAVRRTLRAEVYTSISICLGVPLIVGIGLLAIGWIGRGFRAA
jgi:hypothetical protein